MKDGNVLLSSVPQTGQYADGYRVVLYFPNANAYPYAGTVGGIAIGDKDVGHVVQTFINAKNEVIIPIEYSHIAASLRIVSQTLLKANLRSARKTLS